MTPIEPLAVAGVNLMTIIGGAIGAFISLRFMDDLNTPQRWITFFGGWGLGSTLGQPMVSLMEVKPVWDLGASVLIALFGMALVAAVLNAIKTIDWKSLVTSVIQRLTGGGK